MKTYTVWNPKTNATTEKTQKTRPRESDTAVVVAVRAATDRPPANKNDAGAWDAWRLRQGIAA